MLQERKSLRRRWTRAANLFRLSERQLTLESIERIVRFVKNAESVSEIELPKLRESQSIAIKRNQNRLRNGFQHHPFRGKRKNRKRQPASQLEPPEERNAIPHSAGNPSVRAMRIGAFHVVSLPCRSFLINKMDMPMLRSSASSVLSGLTPSPDASGWLSDGRISCVAFPKIVHKVDDEVGRCSPFCESKIVVV